MKNTQNMKVYQTIYNVLHYLKEKLFRCKVCKILVLIAVGVFAFIVNTQKYGTESVREIAEIVFTVVPLLILFCYLIGDVPKNVESYLERLDLVYEIGEAVSCVSLILIQHIRGAVINKFQSYLAEGIKSKVVFEIRESVVSIIDVWVLVLKISVFFCIGGHIINLSYQLRSCFPRKWKSKAHKARRKIEIGNWKPKPLKNLGSTCYVDCLLQVFISLELVKAFYVLMVSEEVIPNKTLSMVLKKFFMDSRSVRDSPTRHKELVHWVLNESFKFDKGENDPHELLLVMLDNVEVQVRDLFYGIMAHSYKIPECGHLPMYTGMFAGLEVPIDTVRPMTLAGQLGTMESSLVGWECQICCVRRPGTQKFNIVKGPSVLHIQILRFGAEIGRKLNDFVAFPEIFDIGPYMEESSKKYHQCLYRLRGVIEHIGDSCTSGHYIAYVRSQERWYYTSDEIVCEVPLREVLNCKAYLLFYEKDGSDKGKKKEIAEKDEKASKEFKAIADLQKMDEPKRNRTTSVVGDASYTHIALTMGLGALEHMTSVNEVLSGTCSCPVESETIVNLCSSEDGSPVEVNSTIQSSIENHNDNVGAGYSIELSKFSKPAYVPYEELPDLFVTATEENLPVKSEVSPSTCCGAETAEMKYQNPISAGAHSGLLSSVTSKSGHEALLASVLEERHQEEVVCSKNMVEGVSTGHEADVSEATYWNKGPESHELEGFPGSTVCKTAISDIEVNEQEPLCSQQEISLKSLPQALTVRAADGIVSPEDTVVDEPMVAVSGKDGSLREKARKSNAVYAGNFIEEGISAENSVVSPEDVVVHVAVDSISGNGGAFCEEARQINPDNAVNYNGKGALEDYSVQWKINWEADFGESLRETVSIPSKRIKYSKAMIMEAGQLENTIEFISDLLDCRGENPVESSKQVETTTTVSKTDQVKYVGVDCSIAGPLQEGRKSDFSTELDVFHSSENSPIKEPVSPALDCVPCDLQSSILKDGTKVLAAGDVSSLSLKEDENLLLENQLEALTNMPLDGSLGSISQTGSAEGSGSVSDGTFGSSRDAVNSSSILAANTESGFRTYASEIEAIISLQQLHASSSQGGRFPSPNQANNESQGRKKKRSESEEFIQNMVSWNSGKIPPRRAAFLKNVLLKPKFKSKQEAALHGHPRLPPQNDDDTSTFDNDTHTEFVPSVAAPEVCTKKVKKEWISRAKFPCRQKSRWSPLLC